MTATIVFAVIAVLLLITLKDLNPAFVMLGGVYVAVVITSGALTLFSDFLRGIISFLDSDVTKYLTFMAKVAGVSICADVGADICTQMGYSAVAKSLILYGKMLILIMALPLIEEMLSDVRSFSVF